MRPHKASLFHFKCAGWRAWGRLVGYLLVFYDASEASISVILGEIKDQPHVVTIDGFLIAGGGKIELKHKPEN